MTKPQPETLKTRHDCGAPRTHVLTRKANETFSEDPGYWSAVETLRIGWHTYAVGGWDETTEGRAEFGSEPTAGPHAYAFGLAVVISSTPIEDKHIYRDVAIGDLVVVAGHVYVIAKAPNDNISLKRFQREEVFGRTYWTSVEMRDRQRELGWGVGASNDQSNRAAEVEALRLAIIARKGN